MIRIRYMDGRFDMVKSTRLDDLIKAEGIERFKRANGWVVLGKDSVREQTEHEFYSGSERREIATPNVLRRGDGSPIKKISETAHLVVSAGYSTP